MGKPAHNQKLGATGENIAASYLQTAGFTILARNWRYGKLELDLICSQRDTIVFVEVKTRRAQKFGSPAEAITHGKKRSLCLAAQAWLNINCKWATPCRFDVICLIQTGTIFSLEHYPDAFELSPVVDSGHASW